MKQQTESREGANKEGKAYDDDRLQSFGLHSNSMYIVWIR